MIKIVSFEICPFVQRVTGALAAKNIPYEIEYIDLKNKPQWFLALSPNGQVPVLITQNGTALFESDAIIEYIDDEFFPLEGSLSNEEKALDRAWSYLASKHYLVQCSTMRSKDEVTFEERSQKFKKAFQTIEKQLTGTSAYFKSDQLSKVDIAWLPLLHRAAIIKMHSGYDFLCCLPKAQAWQHNILNTGLVEKTVSKDFTERFSQFYLTNTFLAANKCVENNHCSTNSCCD
ncbi:glutathione S-transferase family protein [Pseudoalteromonas sp. SG45-5]|uniref:glutathione S-transferase family protein n=1 Tax=unclassified Pseudoalteromonas TaxID=194690 RepID=UPI0015FB03BB|nr:MULTISPECIES: glutathione S-transferase family protein [unclassified Pseudoalteromonas]MBB1387133.1 glutathione S-transferase family protein [Pseudoalteromonas sp. SG45-5]MBB1395236.1 glutathione S-transferase family protein [Pseudoalteromonas sp. SG44-4]MBB1447244.1 glutathione S-transferase family protein [Pseudoalteromonas sp. SG41-6]